MNRPRLLSVACSLFVAACELEGFPENEMSVVVVADETFVANGASRAVVRIELESAPTPGKGLTVTTSLGVLDPSAPEASRRTRSIPTNASNTVELNLFAERVAGKGKVSVSSDGKVVEEADFEILPNEETLTLTVPESAASDGHTPVPISVSLGTQRKDGQKVTLETTLGSFRAGAPPDSQRTEVFLRDGEMAEVSLLPGTTPGIATIRASVDGGEIDSRPLLLEAPSFEIRLSSASSSVPADSLSAVEVEVSALTTLTSSRSVTLTTTLGSFASPTAAAPVRTVTFGLRGGATAEDAEQRAVRVLLYGGADPGRAQLSASAADVVSSFAPVEVTFAPPTQLFLGAAPSAVLSQAIQSTTVTAYVSRPLGQGTPSNGAQVGLVLCCGAGGTCNELLVPPVVSVVPADRMATASVQLSAAGLAFVGEVGDPPNDNLSAVLHAVALDGSGGSLPACVELEGNGPLAGVSAYDSVVLQLARKPPPGPPEVP